MTDFLEDESDDENTEVERPKPKAKPPEKKDQPLPVVLDVPESPTARRGSSGGSGNLVQPMEDFVEPKDAQARNDREVEDRFKQQPRMGRVIQMRPPVIDATPIPAPSRPVAAPDAPGRSATRPDATKPATAPVAAPSRAVQAAQRAAYEAQVQARRAAEVEARAFAEADMLEPEPGPTRPAVPARVPVRKRTSPFVLLGVAAAATVAAVVFSMWNRPEAEEEEEEEDDTIEGEIVDPPSEEIVEGEFEEIEKPDDKTNAA